MPGTLLLSFPQFTLQRRPPISQMFFLGAFGVSAIFGKVEAVADRLGLCEVHAYFFVEIRSQCTRRGGFRLATAHWSTTPFGCGEVRRLGILLLVLAGR